MTTASDGEGGRRGRPSYLPPIKQMRTVAVCQKCGRTATMGEAFEDGWLIARWRLDPGQWVVRCYGCISEWSLRVSEAGRTVEWRQKMVEGKQRADEEPQWLRPMLAVVPRAEIPIEWAGEILPDDSGIDYGPWIELWEKMGRAEEES